MLIEILILVLAVPVGFLIAYWANDELVVGRKWFLGLIFICALSGAVFAYLGNWTLVFSLGFVVVVSWISYWKSFDRKWTRRRVS